MKISLPKCQFLKKEIKLLGFIITGTGVHSNPDKVDPIRRWPVSNNLNELQHFLGICTFYHKFIKNLAHIAAPLYHLLKKTVEWKWTKESQNGFEKLKAILICLPELAYPNPNVLYELHCDASNVALGAVLVQEGRPIAYASRTLSPAEKNYSTTELECLAVCWSLQYMHCYVYGANLTIFTDHAALKALLSTKDPKGRIARWILAIWNYDFSIFHRKGVENADADTLSRLEIKSKVSYISAQQNVPDLITAQNEDKKIQDIIKETPLDPKFKLVNGILCYIKVNPPVVVIPVSWKPKFLFDIHNNITSGGHQGRDKTLAKAKENGWWLQINQDVNSYVKDCIECKKFKTPTHKFQEMKSKSVGGPCKVWAADIAFLPKSEMGNKYLLVFMEYLTKWVIAVQLLDLSTDAVANVLLYQVVLVLGVPNKFITDNGTNLVSEAMKLVCQRLGIQKKETSVEHPQSDGLVERMNRTMKGALSLYCQKNPTSWDSYLPFITFAINTSKQKSTGVSPFEALFGRKARISALEELQVAQTKTYSSEQWVSYLNHYLPLLHENIHINIQKSQAQQQKYFNQHRKIKESFFGGGYSLEIENERIVEVFRA